MADQEQKPGYVRCAATHIGAEWTVEEFSTASKKAIVHVETEDGTVHFGLTREAVEDLVRQLLLFLEDRPPGQKMS